MRKMIVLLVSMALAHAATGAAQTLDGGINERTKTGGKQAPPAQSARPAIAPDLQDLAVKAARLLDAGEDTPEARRLLGNVRADARFDDQPRDFRFNVLMLAGYAEMSENQDEAAGELFRQASTLQDTDPDLWYWLSWVEARRGEHDEAARSLARLFKRWPDAAEKILDEHVQRVAFEPDASQAARAELLQAIVDSGWKREALGGTSHFHYALALVRAKEGDTEALRRLVPGITGPTDIVRLLGDKRFDAVVDADDPAFDPRAAADRQVAALQAQLRLAPDRLDILSALQTALLMAGRFQEVITLAEDVQAALDAAPADKPAYVAMDELPWVQDQHSRALDALGRFDASLARLEAASRLDEGGRPNVSQALNLAQRYASLGRPADALAAAASAGSDMSDFGRMVQASARQRAHLALGDADAAAKALDYLREHRASAEAIYLDALVEAGELDDAAATLIAQLASAEDRADALYELHDFRKPPTKPGNVQALANWEKLLARPDVEAAVARVGRRLKVDLYRQD